MDEGKGRFFFGRVGGLVVEGWEGLDFHRKVLS